MIDTLGPDKAAAETLIHLKAAGVEHCALIQTGGMCKLERLLVELRLRFAAAAQWRTQTGGVDESIVRRGTPT
jgi:hypothetical protein